MGDGEWISWAYINRFIDNENMSAATVAPAGIEVVADQPKVVEPQGAELLTLLMDAIAHAGHHS